MIFKAQSPTAKIVISDEVPVIGARQFHEKPFAPADPKQTHVIFNFIQVQELLPPPQEAPSL